MRTINKFIYFRVGEKEREKLVEILFLQEPNNYYISITINIRFF